MPGSQAPFRGLDGSDGACGSSVGGGGAAAAAAASTGTREFGESYCSASDGFRTRSSRVKAIDVSAATAHRGLGFDEFWRQHCGWIARITFVSFYAGTVSVWGAVLVFFVTAMETASRTIPIFLGICSAALLGALLLVRHTLREDVVIVQRSLPRIEINLRGDGAIPASPREPALPAASRNVHMRVRAHRNGPMVMC